MFKKIIKNFIVYSISFLLALYLHTGNIIFNLKYAKYYFVFIIAWGISGLLSRKFKSKHEITLLSRLSTYTISFFMMLGILAVLLYEYNLIDVSRTIVLYSLLFAYCLEVFYMLYTRKEKLKLKNINLTYNGFAFLFEVNLFEIISFSLCYFISRNFTSEIDITLLFISLSLSWFTGSSLGHHFSLDKVNRNYLMFIWQYIKTYIIILALALFSAFITQLEQNYLKYVFAGISLYSFISFIGASTYFYIKRHRLLVLNLVGFPIKGEFGDILLNEKIHNIQENHRSNFNTNHSEFLNDKLKNLSLKKHPDVYEFVDKCLDLNTFDNSLSLIIKSNNSGSIEFLPENGLQMLINLERINQVHDINNFLEEIYKKLLPAGIFISNFETLYLRHQRFLENYPYYFAKLFYFFDFLWNRVCSRIILLRVIYRTISRGTQKAMSLAEGLGRLYYCGFEILHLRIIDNRMYFIAIKNEIHISRPSPSTGIFFKMRRLGKNFKPLDVYKIRTMHPYAEYLQRFVYDRFKLQEGGKLNNDFRITYWGKILRKFWLDELPMVYNWLKGDLKLVGCRPLSQQYFNLYTEELKQLRMKYKPGLIPPFYADNPKTLTEIMESEMKYLRLYSENPFRTDLRYFLRCIHNILIRGRRSA